MRAERFDELSRVAGRGISRRRVVRLLAFGTVGGAVAWNTLPSLAAQAASACAIRRVTVWINSFIPRDMVGYTFQMSAGPYAGSTVIPGPPLASQCFLTDQREFQDGQGFFCSSHPSSRLAAVAEIDMINGSLVSQNVFGCPTIEVHCQQGHEICSNQAVIEGPGWHDFSGERGFASVRIKIWGHNPCFESVPGIFIPDNDLDGEFRIVAKATGAVDVTFTGNVDVFPAFEAYAQVEGGQPVQLFNYFPTNRRAEDLLFSQLAVPVFGRQEVRNASTCDPRDYCCEDGSGGTNGCCPNNNTCCPASQGGNCCPNDVAPVCCGTEFCCPTDFTCCQASGCCPPSHPTCCPNNRCCPAGTVCCGNGGCCPPGTRCTVGGCRPAGASTADADVEFIPAQAAAGGHRRTVGRKGT